MALKASALKVGDTHVERVCENLSRTQIVMYCGVSGDYNPLHAEPAAAKLAGYPRPIMHGLGNFGVAGHAVLKTMCGYEPAKLTAFACRFSAPKTSSASSRPAPSVASACLPVRPIFRAPTWCSSTR